MKKAIIAVILIVTATIVMGYSEVKFKADAKIDYRILLTSNFVNNDFANWTFRQARLSVYGNVFDNVYAKFVADVANNAKVDNTWNAYLDWRIAPEFVLSGGLMDSIFGIATLNGFYEPLSDYALKVSGKIGTIGYAVQAIDSVLFTVANAGGLAINQSFIPAIQGVVDLELTKGFNICLGARYNSFYANSGVNVNYITNTEIAGELVLKMNNVIPNLGLTLDAVYLMNSYAAAGVATNLSGFYATAILSYNMGNLVPAVLFHVNDPNLSVSNNMTSWLTLQATYFLDPDKMFAIVPRIDYKLIENDGAAATPILIRCRFQFAFDTPIIASKSNTNI